jgi:hypothetical protein
MLECEELEQQSLRAGVSGRGGYVTEQDSRHVRLGTPALARPLYLLAALRRLVVLRLFFSSAQNLSIVQPTDTSL